MPRDIYIDVTRQLPVRGFTDSSIAPIPPFSQGDTPTLNVWLLVQTSDFNGPAPYSYLGTAGLSLSVALGTNTGNVTLIYAEQLTWTAEPLGRYFTATLSLDTSAINTLLSNNSDATAFFEIKLISSGTSTTILCQQVRIAAAVIKPGATLTQRGSTPISAEDANATFLKRKISGAIFLEDVSNRGNFAAMFIKDGALFCDMPASGPSQPLPSGMAPFAPDPPRD